MEYEKSGGEQWLSRRLDRLEMEVYNLTEELRRARNDFHAYQNSARAISVEEHRQIKDSIKTIESVIDEVPEITENFHRRRGIQDGFAFLSRVVIAVGATVTAAYTLWSFFGERLTS